MKTIQSLVFPWPKGSEPGTDIVARMLVTIVAAWLGGNEVVVRQLENAYLYAIGVDWFVS